MGGRFLHRSLAVALLSSAAPVGAQSGAPRAAVDSLLDRLAIADTTTTIPSLDTCTAHRGSLRKLCRGLIELKRAELTEDRDAAIAAEFELVQVAREQPEWAVGWYGLGMSRLALARARVIAKESLEQLSGMSFEAGAGNALVRALRVEPTFTPALAALARIAIPREGASVLGSRLATLRRHRASLGPLDALGAARVERVAGSRDSAVALLQFALASGEVDSGVVFLELARDLHAAGRAEEGRAALFRGAAHPSETTQDAYRLAITWVAEPAELAQWDALGVADRSAWLQRFWRGRDIKSGWTEGQRLIEHFQRIEYAWQHFTLYLPRLGRHKIATTSYGIDTFVDHLIEQIALGPEGLNAAISEGGAGRSEMSVGTALLIHGQMRVSGLGGPFRAYRVSQEVLDDRGVVWIRYGKPSRQVSSAGGEALQVWAYDNVEPRLVLQFREENFDGQVGASRLVPTLLDVPGRFRDQFCGIEQSLCSFNTQTPDLKQGESPVAGWAARTTDYGRINPGMVDHLVREGEAQIERATTTDAAPRPFAAPLAPLVQVLGVRHAAAGEPRVVAAFAIPAEQLAHHSPPEAGGRTVYSLRFVLSALDARGVRRDLDTLRHLTTPAPLQPGQYLSGIVQLAVPEGRQDVSLTVTQPDGRGAVASLAAVPFLASGRLSISSVVLGSRVSGVAWESGRVTVPLHPLNAFRQGQEASLYFQLGGLRRGDAYRTTIELFPAGETNPRAALSLALADEAEQDFTEVQRTIDLRNLEPGRYRLRVTVQVGEAVVYEEAFLNVLRD